jgi:hypothetical protein
MSVTMDAMMMSIDVMRSGSGGRNTSGNGSGAERQGRKRPAEYRELEHMGSLNLDNPLLPTEPTRARHSPNPKKLACGERKARCGDAISISGNSGADSVTK